MTKIITFKTFLTESLSDQDNENNLPDDFDDDEDLDSEDYYRPNKEDSQRDSELADLIVSKGFKNNFMDMVEDETYLYRGIYSNFGPFSGSKNQDKLGLIIKPRTENRKSIFTGKQFTANLWHAFKLPSRSRCFMATSNKDMADDFGYPHFIIPKDGTQLNGLPQDWNLSYSDEMLEYFNLHGKLGRLPGFIYSLVDFISDIESELDSDPAQIKELIVTEELLNNIVNYKISDFHNFCQTLDIIIDTAPASKLHSLMDEEGHDDTYDFLRRIISNLKKQSTFKLFSEFATVIGNQVVESKDPVNLIKQIHYSERSKPEIWWTADSLLLSQNVNKTRMKEIYKFVKEKK